MSLRDLVRETLRMRPTRIIVGEVRAAECLDLLLALNAGLPGMATIHANSAREALVKLCTLPLLAGEGYPVRSERECAPFPCCRCRVDPLLPAAGVGLPVLSVSTVRRDRSVGAVDRGPGLASWRSNHAVQCSPR